MTANLTMRERGRVARSVADESFDANTDYFLHVTGELRDSRDGRRRPNHVRSGTGTTIDAIPPAVEGVSPPAGATNVDGCSTSPDVQRTD